MSIQTEAYEKIKKTNPTAMTGSGVLGIGGKAESMFGGSFKAPTVTPPAKNASGVLGLGGKAESMFGGSFKAPTVTPAKSYSTPQGSGVGNPSYTESKNGSYPQGPLVRVNQYKPPNSVYDVEWNPSTRQVMVAGQAIPYHHIDEDGNSWAYQSVLDAAYAKQGIKDTDYLTKGYNTGYENRMAALDAIKNQKFEYTASDLENDIAWQAYQKMYQREADRAYKDALSQVAARTGGNVSSMARSQAAQQRDYFLSKMTDAIPTIQQQAYSRWLDDRNSQIDIIGRQDDMDRNKLDIDWAANDAQRSYIKENQEAAKNRVTDAIELENVKSDSELKLKENTYQGAALVNRPFTQEEASFLGIAPREDGTYPSPNQIVIEMQNEVWELYEKGRLEYENAKALEQELTVLSANYEIEKDLATFKNGLSKSLAAYNSALNKSEAAYKKSLEDDGGGWSW